MTETNYENVTSRQSRNFMIFSSLRAAMGIVWIFLAISVWSSEFAQHIHQYNLDAFQNPHGWLSFWFGTWVAVITPAPEFFLYFARIVTVLIAFCLIFGFARKASYIIGILAVLPLWTLMEGYTSSQAFGTINLGLAISYILFFLSFLLINRHDGTTPHSLDLYIIRKWPAWRHVSDLSNINLPSKQPMSIPWGERIPIIFAVVGVLALLVGTSVISGHVGPFQIGPSETSGRLVDQISVGAVKAPHKALLPPLLGTGDSVDIKLVATDKTVEIANGIKFNGWTFNDTIPAPVLHVREGQTINVTFVNNGDMLHSIDFHSAMIAPSKAYINIDPGESLEFSFKAEVPGIFIYHCGTPPVLEHMANGMYGAIVVDPKVPLPTADVSYVIVQSEFYTKQAPGNTYDGGYTKMKKRIPDLVTFNGVAFQYEHHPLPVKVGERVRIYFLNAGVIQWSAFHVIGGIFDKVYPSGDVEDALTGVSTYSVAPGEGDVFDLYFPEPGLYPFVDHNMANMELGAHGLFYASEDGKAAEAETSESADSSEAMSH